MILVLSARPQAASVLAVLQLLLGNLARHVILTGTQKRINIMAPAHICIEQTGAERAGQVTCCWFSCSASLITWLPVRIGAVKTTAAQQLPVARTALKNQVAFCQYEIILLNILRTSESKILSRFATDASA